MGTAEHSARAIGELAASALKHFLPLEKKSRMTLKSSVE